MKKILYSLATIVALFVTHGAFAQLPDNVKVSNAGNDYWYYIQNAANPEVVKTGSTYSDNGGLDKAGFFISSRGGNGSNQVFGDVYYIHQDKELQMWKLVDAGSGAYNLVNKKTGNKLALGTSATAQACLGTDAPDCADLFYTNTDGNASYEIKLIGKESNSVIIKRTGSTNKLLAFSGISGNDKETSLFEAAIEDEYDLPQDTVITKSEKAWIFISETEMAERAYPEMSTEGNEKWYTFDMISTGTSKGKTLFVRVNPANPSQYMLSRASTRNEADSTQLWKFIQVPGDNKQMYIVNKSMSDKFVSYSEAGYVIDDEAKAFVIKDIRNGEFGIMPVDTAWNHGRRDGLAFTATGVVNAPITIGTANVDQASAYNYVSTFKFTLVGSKPAGIQTISKESFTVYTENGYIKIVGTDEPFKVYTISGQRVNEKNQLPKGVYIVKINSTSKKVMVY